MPKFHGKIGFGEPTEVSDGVFVDLIVEHLFYGDVVRNTRGLHEAEKLNKDLSIGNSISIVGNEFANGNFHAIRYVEWAGKLWTVTDVEVEAPRLLLRLGEVYNGPTPDAP